MAYEKPPCSANQIDKAGRIFFDENQNVDERAKAIDMIWDWRTAHGYPLNAIHMTLRNRALRVDQKVLTAQRLKRLPSILRKLSRQTTMQMSQMQDVGGCRAVVTTMPRLEALRAVYTEGPLRHELIRERDYVVDPKEDGYRSVHQMYRFCGRGSSLPWDRLRIEVQMRTQLQHAWATCVETVDAFTSEDLKFGKGTSEWRRFFQLVGSVHARIENSPLVPATPKSERELLDEVKLLTDRLEVIRLLRSYARLTSHITAQRGAANEWYIIQMKPTEGKAYVSGFAKEAFPLAKRRLAELEKQFQGTNNQVVLVKTESVNELRKAYPNYFADTGYFTSVLERFVA
jgi:Region found in RelA / SpoT proteins